MKPIFALSSAQSRTFFFLGLSAFLLLITWIIPSFFTHPVGDDLTYAWKGINSSSFSKTWFNEYQYWNGRYFSNLLVLVNPIVWNNFGLYQIIPVLLIGATFWSCFHFLKSIFITQLNFKERLSIALLWTVVFLQLMPIPSEGIYWYTGAVTYQTATIFITFICSLILRYQRKMWVLNQQIHQLLLLLLIICSIGCNEVSMLILLIGLTGWNFHSYQEKKQLNSFYILLFLIAFICSSFVVFAPGNAVRGTYFEDVHHSFWHSLLWGTLQTFRFTATWLISPVFLVLNVLFLLFKLQLQKNRFHKPHYPPIYWAILLFLVLFVCFFPPYWSTGILGQHRTANVACFFFIPIWIQFLSTLIDCYPIWIGKRTKFLQTKTNVIAAVAITFLFFSGNTFHTITDFATGEFKKYDSQMSKREKIMIESQPLSPSKLDIPYLQSKPETIFIIDLKTPDHWVNEGYALYFNLSDCKIVAY